MKHYESTLAKVLKNVGIIHVVIGLIGGIISAFVVGFITMLFWWWGGFVGGLIYWALGELINQFDETHDLQVQQMKNIERKLDTVLERLDEQRDR
ncbi:hypothetical protein [Alkalihalobacillus sp. AL-G]|uniref:hypothetical protein n=1 Tax=Alkalihalobacillus sp. AL-G TaxID=2926399 RepID=UPI00272D8626|nr:hypothetical protein [Alkalihalobacillus sp. AL-G]WLD91597.1 hypothetical protein MOJ78_11115 [Alkalihalobacillus sp. AL-G]